MTSIGSALLAPLNLHHDATPIASCLGAFDLPSWNKPLRYLILNVDPSPPHPEYRGGTLKRAERAQVLRECLEAPGVEIVSLSTTAKATNDYAELSIETQPRIGGYPFASICGQQRIVAASGDRYDAWVRDLLLLAERVRATHGIFTVMPHVTSEVTFVGIRSDGVLQHPDPDEFERMREAERDLGVRYVRFPRWGTIYSAAHVEELGGRERICEVVRPAVVRDIGEHAIYFQLTETVATAISSEAIEKQSAFTKLAEPLLPPRRATQA